jgi:hypothetical protein
MKMVSIWLDRQGFLLRRTGGCVSFGCGSAGAYFSQTGFALVL